MVSRNSAPVSRCTCIVVLYPNPTMRCSEDSEFRRMQTNNSIKSWNLTCFLGSGIIWNNNPHLEDTFSNISSNLDQFGIKPCLLFWIPTSRPNFPPVFTVNSHVFLLPKKKRKLIKHPIKPSTHQPRNFKKIFEFLASSSSSCAFCCPRSASKITSSNLEVGPRFGKVHGGLTSPERNDIRRCPLWGIRTWRSFAWKKHDCRWGGFRVIFVYLGSLDSFYAPIMTMKGEVGFLQWTWNGLLHCREKHNCIVIFTRVHENP